MEFHTNEFLSESEKDPRLTKALETYFGKKDTKKDPGTDKFIRDLYSYPPKFSVYRNYDSSSRRDALPLEKIGNTPPSLRLVEVDESGKEMGPVFIVNLNEIEIDLSSLKPTPKMPRELDRFILERSSYSTLDYFNGFVNKNFTSNCFATAIKPLKKALETTPVYVVLNGQDEIVLAHEPNFGGPRVPNNRIYDLCGAFADNGTLKNGKLGLAFFGYNDAKTFMDAMIELEPDETSIVGLAIHCVSLGSFYELMRSNHPGIDFRLIPNVTDIVSSYAIAEDPHFLFQEELFVNQYCGSDISDLTGSPLQNLTKGVPVYLVQLQEDRRGIAEDTLRSIVSKADRLTAFLVRPHKLGRKIMKGPLPTKQAFATAHLFFDYRKALDFCKENNRFIVPLSGSYLSPKLDNVVQKPIIFATNLEILLEYLENNLIIEVNDNKNLVACNTEMPELWRTLEFVPIRESEKPWDVEKSKLLNSPIRKMCREIKVRYKILSSFLEYIWIA